MSRRRPCDACGVERKRGQRLCDACFGRLDRHIRANLIAAHREGRTKDWREWRRIARTTLACGAAPSAPRVSAAQAFDLTQRLLGER